ncbi:MAG: Rrf2 family transcriptional regulator [Lachnospirales bacterium]
MKVSTRSRYGLKALLEIATEKDEKCVSLQSISDKLGISVNYLEQIIAVLKKDGIVKSVRGAKGGYVLAKDMEEISFGEILRSLEGDLYPVNCLNDEIESTKGSGCSCGESCSSECLTKETWTKLYNIITVSIDNISLKDILEKNL